MADLIDRAALLADIDELHEHCGHCDGYGYISKDKAMQKVKAAPAVDAVEVKYGHWQEYEDYCLDLYYACSVCDGLFYMADGTPTENGYNFCPKCSARLDKTIRVEVEDYATD